MSSPAPDSAADRPEPREAGGGRVAGWPGRIALAAAGVFLVTVAWLLSRPGPDYRTQPMELWDIQNTAESAHGFRSWALPADAVQPRDGAWEHRWLLESLPSSPSYGWHEGHYRPDPGIRWSDLRSLGFHLEPAGGAGPHGCPGPEVVAARLRGPDGSEFALRSAQRAKRGHLLELDRVGQAGAAGATQAGPVELTLVTREPSTNLCLRVLRTPRGSAYGALRKTLADPSAGDLAWPFGRLTYPQPDGPGTRAGIIAGWWKWPGGLRGVLVRLAGLAVLLAVGVSVVMWVPGPWRLAGIGLMFGALGSLQVWLTPPLAAMDERGHFLSLLWETGNLGRRDAALEEGRRVHAARLIFRPDQKFARADLDEPSGFFLPPGSLDPEVIGNFAQRPRERSPLAARVWTLLSGRMASGELVHGILAVRTVHLWITAAAVAGCAVLLGAGLRGLPGADALPWVFGLIPCLPFFGMILSNYPFLVAGSCLLAGSLTLLVWGRGGGWGFGCLVGLGLGLVWHSSRAGLPVGATFAIAALALAAVPGRGPGRFDGRTWLGLGLGLLVTRGGTTGEYDLAMVRQLPGLRGLAAGPASWLITGGLVLAWLGLGAMGWVWRRYGPAQVPSTEMPGRAPRTLNRGLALAGLASLAMGLFLAGAPRLADIEYYSFYPLVITTDVDVPPLGGEGGAGSGISAPAYAAQALRAFWGSFGASHPEFFTSRMFWSGFGSFDTLLPGWLVVGLGWVFLLGWVRLAWRAGSPGERPVPLGPVCLGLVATLGVVLLAYSCAAPPVGRRTLIGRYLMPWYLMFLVPAWSGWLGSGRWLERWRGAWPVLALAVHGLAVATILGRYF